MTKADATRWLASVEADLSRGDLPDPDSNRIRFDEYAQDWFADKAALRPKTVELYDYLLRCHILPTFAEYPIGRVDAPMVRTWHAGLLTGGLSQASAAKAYRLLRQILAAAADDRYLRENPCRLRGAAAEKSAERVIPSLEQVALLAKATDPRYRAMVYLAALVGLRKGECMGLARRHVVLDGNPTVRIERQVVHLHNGTLMQEPKTAAGTRTVALPDVVADRLAEHLAAHVGPGADALLFPAPTGGVMSKMSWRRIWDKATEAAGYEGTFHDLRHVAGTLNATAGASLKEAMARLGHASPAAALRYQHAVQSRDVAVAGRVNELIDAFGSEARPG